MSSYSYRNNTYRTERGRRRAVFVGLGLSTIVFLVGLVIGADLYRQKKEAVMPESIGHTSAVAADTIQVFRTKYFQFQTDDSWGEVANNNDNIYIYRSLRGTLVQQDLTIYVNVEPPTSDITRVQPVSTVDNRIKPNGPISDHCRVILPPNANKVPTKVTMGGVSFTCRADGTLFIVLVADTKGLPSFRLNRPDGTSAQYTMVYRDLTTYPDGRNLEGIIDSFQTR